MIFTAEDSEGIDAKPNDAIIVGVQIAHRDILRVIINNGSSTDILSARVYDELRLDRKDLDPFHVPLKGFRGAEVRSLGTVKLPVRFGTTPCRRTIQLDFVVVDIYNWPYNTLLGRPFLNKAWVVTSTHALKVKFSMGFRIGELKGSQEMTRCANLSIFKDKSGADTLSIFVLNQETQEENPEIFELDPRDKADREKEEPTEFVILDEKKPDRTFKIGARLAESVKTEIANLPKEYKGIFTWSHEDIPGISTSVISHYLAIDDKSKPVVQKRRSFSSERSIDKREEISKLLVARSIREVNYPEWVANVVLMKKKNNQWRICVDFTDLNKTCPKDSFSLPRIDQLVDAIAGHKLLNFMDAYSGYNQIKMHKPNKDKTASTTDQGLYCYTVMPFGLKNARATYQWLVNRMFASQIGRNMEVYVDDILTKSITVDKHVDDLRETFNMLTKYGMKLNPSKCVFGVPSGKFLGYQRCVEPEEAEGILKDIHSGSCGNHTGGVSLTHKALRQGFYWPTLFTDAKSSATRCEACQKVTNNIHQPPEHLQSITSPWPFAMWGIDLIGPMPATAGRAKHAIVVVDYFTKWVEAEPLVHKTETTTTNFVKKNILYRFGILNTIITDRQRNTIRQQKVQGVVQKI
ncbi:hypothetical protein LWI29_033042 [Acer saccharum]|uniref:Reverse transcriptase domain-containing protein n=1 Tax=Acer saccharum TaxID=4024 RepID=A0AA39T5C4_ACESA|nr:hypothetical protein LWI29_033042 [Acer saccharum]